MLEERTKHQVACLTLGILFSFPRRGGNGYVFISMLCLKSWGDLPNESGTRQQKTQEWSEQSIRLEN